MKNQISSLKIGLLDNSYHSLKRGYEMWSEWKISEDAWLLKESVIWVHHGIELVLKQLLVQTNEFLVFEDVNRAIEGLGRLRKKKGMENVGVLDLFDHEDKVMSVGFKNLIDRTAIALSIHELTENEPLRLKIEQLARYRNKIVHFSIELDIILISNLLSEILDPLLTMLAREVEDENFKNKGIPEIRRVAQPVQKFIEQMRSETVNNAVRVTLGALPPNGNRKAGIVWQVVGSGLASSLASYLMKTRLSPRLKDSDVIVVVDRSALAAQIYRNVSDLALHDKTIKVFLPESRTVLVETLESKEPKIIISTLQTFELDGITISKECLVVGYNLHSTPERLPIIFPNATYVLFTNMPPHQDIELLQIFGGIISKYDLSQAINDGIANPVNLEVRKLENSVDFPFSTRSNTELDGTIPFRDPDISTHFVAKLAQDIVQHFELRQRIWIGKGIVVVPSIDFGEELSYKMAEIMLMGPEQTEPTQRVTTISTMHSPMDRAALIERFRKQDDSLTLLIMTGSFLLGFDNPLLHTIYVTNSVSLQLRYLLAGLVSKRYQDKKDGLIVDYVGLDWSM